MPSSTSRLDLRQAVALGLIHGPAELLPISSSGHVTVVPWLLGWDYAELDEDVRKAFEVALHAGTAAAVVIADRGDLLGDLPLVTLSAAPAALAGYLLEGAIKRHLGTPRTVAAGLIAGAVAMAAADRAPQRRRESEAAAADALWLGVAQACALAPGISRSGATLAAARLRQFTRDDAARLSRRIALAPIAGATLLEAIRFRGRAGLPLAAGATAAFASTWIVPRPERGRPLLPFALYRIALAGAVLTKRRLPAPRNAK
jgi:undecaprenyl-diphosphatase